MWGYVCPEIVQTTPPLTKSELPNVFYGRYYLEIDLENRIIIKVSASFPLSIDCFFLMRKVIIFSSFKKVIHSA